MLHRLIAWGRNCVPAVVLALSLVSGPLAVGSPAQAQTIERIDPDAAIDADLDPGYRQDSAGRCQ